MYILKVLMIAVKQESKCFTPIIRSPQSLVYHTVVTDAMSTNVYFISLKVGLNLGSAKEHEDVLLSKLSGTNVIWLDSCC